MFRDREYLSRCAVEERDGEDLRKGRIEAEGERHGEGEQRGTVEDVGDHHDGLAVDRVRQHAGRQVDQQREVGDEADDGGLEDRSACREHKEGKGDK